MSIYNISRVIELAIDRMKIDLGKQGYTKDNDFFFRNEQEYEDFFSFTPYQSNNYMTFMRIVKDVREWTFYTDETIDELIIQNNYELSQMAGIFDTEECLEEAKEDGVIEGFIELGDDIWLIKE